MNTSLADLLADDDGEQVLVLQNVVETHALPIELGTRPLDSSIPKLSHEVTMQFDTNIPHSRGILDLSLIHI